MHTPPFEITSATLKYVSSIRTTLGKLEGYTFPKPDLKLRKENKVKSIQASLEIEGNHLGTDLVTAIINNKRVIGGEREVLEVVNANKVYDKIADWKYDDQKSFLAAHQILMEDLIERNGKYRDSGVAVVKGSEIIHMAPPHSNVPYLMNDLFDYIMNSDDDMLIKSTIAHYEIEFIHPFSDGNGRIGRLWQTIILAADNPVFEHLPFETVIRDYQSEYYQALADADKLGKANPFLEYMLFAIDTSLTEYKENLDKGKPQTAEERIEVYLAYNPAKRFTRLNYREVWQEISPATASRDLKLATEKKWVDKRGDKNTTEYIPRKSYKRDDEL